MSVTRICLIPRVSGVGGMVSFRNKFKAGLLERGIHVTDDLRDLPYQAVLVIGGTRQVTELWRVRRRGIPIIQRLNGINWLHKVRKSGQKPIHLRLFLRAEYGNWILALIRSRLASRIVYQSEFSQRWWEREYGKTPATSCIVYNGVDLQQYTPEGPQDRPTDQCRVLIVEGSLMGGYESGLDVAIQLASGLSEWFQQQRGQSENTHVELSVVGRLDPKLKNYWNRRLADSGQNNVLKINWVGSVPGEQIPQIDRSAHLLYSADVNAACPNSVIEALACGLPVLAFDTGALPELVGAEAGRVVAYGGDPWRLDPPDVNGLIAGAVEIYQDQAQLRQTARKRAESLFSLEQMVTGYLAVID